MKLAKITGKSGLLICSWVALFLVLTILTEFTLAPWNTAVERPEVGTWQRSLNDYFETSPGRYTLSLPIVVLSIILTIIAIRRNPGAINRLVVIHMLFTPAVFIFWMAAVTVNNAVHPYPPVLYDPGYRGYYRSIIPMMGIVTACAVWFIQQMRLAQFPHPKLLRG